MLKRRTLLGTVVIALNLLLIGTTDSSMAWAADGQIDKTQNEKALEARDVASALAIMEVQNPGTGEHILLEVPEIVDRNQDFSVKVKSIIPNTDWIAVLVDKNKFPLLGQFDLADPKTSAIETKTRLMQTSTVIAVVRAGGKYYRVDKEVKVALP